MMCSLISLYLLVGFITAVLIHKYDDYMDAPAGVNILFWPFLWAYYIVVHGYTAVEAAIDKCARKLP